MTEYKYRRSLDGKGEEWCLVNFSVSEREDGKPKSAILTIRSIESLMREQEEQRRQHMAESLANMSEGFFIYSAVGSEKVLYVNSTIIKMYGCKTLDEFREYVGNTFKGMVHPDDYNRIEYEIADQIKNSERKMDYIRYRIIRKDGEIRWIDDCGHLEESTLIDGTKIFYVFLRDITEEITESQKMRLLKLNELYN